MNSVDSTAYSQRTVLLLLCTVLALLTALLITATVRPQVVTAQVSPLSPLPVATPLPQSQPPVAATDAPSPLPRPQADRNRPPATAQSSTGERTPAQAKTPQPLIPLGKPARSQPSLFLAGALLAGLVLFVVLVVRRRE